LEELSKIVVLRVVETLEAEIYVERGYCLWWRTQITSRHLPSTNYKGRQTGWNSPRSL